MTQKRDPDKIESSRRLQTWGAAVIILMIVLMLMPWNTANHTQHSGKGVPVGTAGDITVSSIDEINAARTMETLETLQVQFFDPRQPGSPIQMPLLEAVWGRDLIAAMKKQPAAFHLLVLESRKIGPGANRNVLGPLEIDAQSTQQPGVLNSGRIQLDDLNPLPGSALFEVSRLQGIPMSQPVIVGVRQMTQISADGYVPTVPVMRLSPMEQSEYYFAMQDLLTIQSAASLAGAAVKPSMAMVDQLIARTGQSFTLEVANIDALPLASQLPDPTEADLQAQLAKYADVVQGTVTDENPFGFGYRVADSVKYQMLSFKRSDIRAIVQAEKTNYDWEVEARMAYAKDASTFSALAPTTAPTTTQPAATNATAFEQIKEGATRLMIDRAVENRISDIERKIRTTTGLDYQRWKTSQDTKTATQPSSLGVNYDSVEYLSKLATSIQAEPRFKILPNVVSEGSTFKGIAELRTDSNIENLIYVFPEAVARARRLPSIFEPAAFYLIEYARPFMAESEIATSGSSVLELFKMSDRLTDESEETIAFVRLTAVQDEHPAKDLAPVRGRVAVDWKKAKAQDQAIANAKLAADAIKAGGQFEVPGAAVATITADAPSMGGTIPPELNLNAPAYQQFFDQVGKQLMVDPSGQPVAVLNVPLAQKVYVARRTGIQAKWTSAEELEEQRVIARGILEQRLLLPKGPLNVFGLTDKAIMLDWLSVDAVLSRNEYKPVGAS